MKIDNKEMQTRIMHVRDSLPIAVADHLEISPEQQNNHQSTEQLYIPVGSH